MIGRWFSPGTLVSSTNKTDRHDITEILLKVMLNTIYHQPPSNKFVVSEKKTFHWYSLKVLCQTMSCNGGHVEFLIHTKNEKFVRDHWMIIHIQFGFNHVSSLWRIVLIHFPLGMNTQFFNSDYNVPNLYLRIECILLKFHWGMKALTEVHFQWSAICSSINTFIPHWNFKRVHSILIIIFKSHQNLT